MVNKQLYLYPPWLYRPHCHKHIHSHEIFPMCIAIPSRIVAIADQMATVDVHGARREVSLMLLPDEAAIDDYVLVHAGFAIQKIDQQAGEETLQLFEQILNQST